MNKVTLATLSAIGTGLLAACEPPVNDGAVPPGAQAQFDAADANGDGVITRQEGVNAPGLDFSRADADNDQSITRQEFNTAMALSGERG